MFSRGVLRRMNQESELKTRPIYECRCDERLQTTSEKSEACFDLSEWTTLIVYKWLLKLIQDEDNIRNVCECDGWVCVLEVIDTPSILSVIRKTTVLKRVLAPCCRLFLSGWPRTSRDGSGIVHGHVALDELLKWQKSGQFPDEPVRVTVQWIHYVTSH